MSTDPLRQEHDSLQRAVQASRAAFRQSPESVFAKTMREAMDEYHAMREAGVSREDACRGLEAVLRDQFKASRFGPACDRCEDVGYKDRICSVVHRCQRQRCVEGHQGLEHRYVEPCVCPVGDNHRRRVIVPSEEDAVLAVGRTKRKAPGWKRVGS